jgi:hypothetical protein
LICLASIEFEIADNSMPVGMQGGWGRGEGSFVQILWANVAKRRQKCVPLVWLLVTSENFDPLGSLARESRDATGHHEAATQMHTHGTLCSRLGARGEGSS